jgi:transcriptional regulator with XRE-family HTH domain
MIGGYMLVGTRIREIRAARKLTQGDIERRTGLLRCYVSRVENNHTTPSVETMHKLARALEVPTYALFVDDGKPVREQAIPPHLTPQDRVLRRFIPLLGRMTDRQRALLLDAATALLRRKHPQPR